MVGLRKMSLNAYAEMSILVDIMGYGTIAAVYRRCLTGDKCTGFKSCSRGGVQSLSGAPTEFVTMIGRLYANAPLDARTTRARHDSYAPPASSPLRAPHPPS